jgi:hypothetical protein
MPEPDPSEGDENTRAHAEAAFVSGPRVSVFSAAQFRRRSTRRRADGLSPSVGWQENLAIYGVNY